MTRRQAEIKLREATENYHEVLAMLVAIVRRQGSVYVERESLADADVTVYGVRTDPTPDGLGFSISIVRKGQAEPTVESHAVN